MKRRLTGAAACLLLVLTLVGCEQAPEPASRAEPPAVVTPNPAPTPTPTPEPADEELVLLQTYLPSVFVDLKYATTDNFTGSVIYDFTAASLRYGTVKKLAAAQETLLQQGTA